MKYTYNLLVLGQNMVINHFITTEINLMEAYKNALVLGSGVISWEKGAIDSRHVIGLFDNTPPPTLKVEGK